MTKQQAPQNDVPEGLSTLVDEVMRGERVIWLPPGALISSMLMPCLCGAVVPLVFLMFENVFLIQKDDFGVAATFYPMGAGLALIFVAAIMFVLLIRGHIQYGRRLLYYVRGLFGVAVILTLAILAGWLDASPISAGISVFSFILTLKIISSLSFSTLASFCSLKRSYRERAENELKAKQGS